MKIKALFVTANLIIITAAMWVLIPDRVFELRMQRDLYNINVRRLLVLEENYRIKHENAALLEYLRYNNEYIIQPTGQTGTVLSDIRGILFSHGLAEHDFFASEQAVHNINGNNITEIRTAISASGEYSDIAGFIKSLTEYGRYLRLENIQITNELDYAHLRLSLIIYEESAR